MFCPECGFKNNDENKFCMKCGKAISEGFVKKIVKETTETDDNAKIDFMLKQVFSMLEERNWEGADEYCEKILEIDPECAQAYLGKMMAEIKASKKDEISKAAFYGKSDNYNRLVKYSDDNLKNEIMLYNKQWLYNHAENIKLYSQSKNELLKAEAIFLYLDDFLDSKIKAEECEKRYTEIAEKNIIFCPECGFKNNDDNQFCLKCGKDISRAAEVLKKSRQNDTLENVPGICPKCGYHNSPSSTKCIRCDFELERSDAYNNRNFENISNERYNDRYTNNGTAYTAPSVPHEKKEEPDYSMFSSEYKSKYKYKMLKVSLACSIGGAITVIAACFMSLMNIDLSLFNMFIDMPQDSYNIKFIDIEPNGILIMLFMVLLIILSVLKRQKASVAPLISSVILFCHPLTEMFSNLGSNDPDSIFAKNITEAMYEFGAGFYLMIIGFIIIVIGIFLAYRDNWDKTTRTMQYAVSGIMAIIVVVAIWLGSDNLYSDSAESFVDYHERYCCEISLIYDMNEAW